MDPTPQQIAATQGPGTTLPVTDRPASGPGAGRDAALTTVTSQARGSYYGIAPIKKPHWQWEIVLYFFLGGIAAGAYTLATIAEVFGDRRHRPIVRAGRYIALPCLLISPVLLIKDLGMPRRFFHMLRIVKLKSPMSLGTWGLLAFSGFAGLSAVAELAAQGFGRGGWPARLAGRLPRRGLGCAGSFFALFVGGYTGVLLSATTVPLWAKNKYLLGPTFISSALSTGAAAITLALAATGQDDDAALHALEEAEILALTSELGFLAAQGVHAGPLARPLLTGKYGTIFVPGVVLGMVWPLLAQLHGIRRGRRTRRGRIVTSLGVLLGGLILRWTLVYAGKDSADDQRPAQDQ